MNFGHTKFNDDLPKTISDVRSNKKMFNKGNEFKQNYVLNSKT